MDSLLEEQRKINQELMNEMKNMQMQASVLGTGSGKKVRIRLKPDPLLRFPPTLVFPTVLDSHSVPDPQRIGDADPDTIFPLGESRLL